MKLVDFSKEPPVWGGTKQPVKKTVERAVSKGLMQHGKIYYSKLFVRYMARKSKGDLISLDDFKEFVIDNSMVTEEADTESAKSAWARKINNYKTELVALANKTKKNPTSNLYRLL